MRDQSLHILQHSLGLDDFGQGKPYRNHFVTGPGCDNWSLCMAHVEAGRMVRHEPREIFGGADSYCFVVTEAGKEFVREHSPKPPKLTRSQRMYQRFLDCDSGMKFGEWLKRHPAATEKRP
jgi:hypothetical protein